MVQQQSLVGTVGKKFEIKFFYLVGNLYFYTIKQTNMEDQILAKLKELKKAKKYTALSLHPGIGMKTVRKDGNIMFINEGRDGKWEGVSEAFYDRMVDEYDSRSRPWRKNK